MVILLQFLPWLYIHSILLILYEAFQLQFQVHEFLHLFETTVLLTLHSPYGLHDKPPDTIKKKLRCAFILFYMKIYIFFFIRWTRFILYFFHRGGCRNKFLFGFSSKACFKIDKFGISILAFKPFIGCKSGFVTETRRENVRLESIRLL